MENLQAFHARVDGFQRDSLPHEGLFITKPLLVEKVAPDGRLRPFFGNTMIFDLPQDVQLQIAAWQVRVHHRCSAMLAQPLEPATLHMTLHDLLNGVDAAALAEPVRQTGEQAKTILAELRKEEKIRAAELRAQRKELTGKITNRALKAAEDALNNRRK